MFFIVLMNAGIKIKYLLGALLVFIPLALYADVHVDLALKGGFSGEDLTIEVPYVASGHPEWIRFDFGHMNCAVAGVDATLWFGENLFLNGELLQSVNSPRTQLDISDHQGIRRTDANKTAGHSMTSTMLRFGYQFSNFENFPGFKVIPSVGLIGGQKSPGRFETEELSWDPRFVYWGTLLGIDVEKTITDQVTLNGGVAYEWRKMRTRDMFLGFDVVNGFDPPAALDLGSLELRGLHYKASIEYKVSNNICISLFGRYFLLTRSMRKSIALDPSSGTLEQQNSRVRTKNTGWLLGIRASYLFL